MSGMRTANHVTVVQFGCTNAMRRRQLQRKNVQLTEEIKKMAGQLVGTSFIYWCNSICVFFIVNRKCITHVP